MIFASSIVQMAQSTLSKNVLLCAFVLAIAQTPSFAYAQKKGYTVDYLDAWPVSSQMKFIRANITPIGGVAPADTDFYVVVNFGSDQRAAISTKVSLKKGDSSATGELYVPVNSGYNVSIHTETDGNLVYNRRDYALRSYYDFASRQYGTMQDKPTFVFASSKIIGDQTNGFTISSKTSKLAQNFNSIATSKDYPKFSDLTDVYSNSNFGGGRTFMTVDGVTSPQIAHMSLGALPSRWFAYEGLDMVVMTFEDVQLMAKKYPGKLLALERWVAASGRLMVLNCGDKLENTDTVLKLLGDEDTNFREKRNSKYLKRPFKLGELAVLQNTTTTSNVAVPIFGGQRVFKSSNQTPQYSTPKIARSAVDDGPVGKSIRQGKANGMIAVDFKDGQVVCISDPYSFWGKETKDKNLWLAVQSFLNLSDRQVGDSSVLFNSTPLRRFGFPEFDEPPRYVFETSILLYLLAVGPLTFFILKRKHLLNLMFVVVPAISFAFCTGILAYAIFAEGFETRVNFFSASSLNQNSGRLTTSGLSHVYSGVTPSDYRFEGPSYGMVNMPRRSRVLKIRWGDEAESLSGGEIRARTNHQLFSRSSTETDRKLGISTKNENGGDESTMIRNGFNTQVIAVALKTKSCGKDEVWLCENLLPGDAKPGIKTTLQDAAKKLRVVIRARGSSTVFAKSNNSGQSRSNRNSYYEDSDVESSSISQTLAFCWNLQEKSLGRAIAPANGSIKYFAVTESCDSFQTPIPDAKIESNIHVIFGEQ